jgi:copper transport protein
MVAVAVIVVTGVVNSFGAFAQLSDLWDVTYGKVVAAKVILLAAALAFAALHRFRTPKRLAQPAGAAGAVATFERTSAGELLAMGVAVALAAALIALVPGKSLALAAKGPVNQERRAGPYTVQLFIDPTAVGDNQVHVTFVNAKGLAATEVATAQVSLGDSPIAMRLISPGHFVGDTSLPAPGPYRLAVNAADGVSTTFEFRLYARSS